jgi:hypothetical protein
MGFNLAFKGLKGLVCIIIISSRSGIQLVGFFRRYSEHGSCDGMFRLMQAFSSVKT